MNRRRQLFWAFATFAAIATWDFSSRIYVDRDDSVRTFEQQPLEPLARGPSPELVRDDVFAWMPGLIASARETMDTSDPSGWDLSLAGVFRKDKGIFALVVARPRTGGETARLLWVKEGDELLGSSVRDIEAKRIELSHGDAIRELVLFDRGSAPVPAAQAKPKSTGSARSQMPEGLEGRARIEWARERLKERRGRSSKSPNSDVLGSSPARQVSPGKEGKKSIAPALVPSGSSQDEISEPRRLEPGEVVKLPWDLPVVESPGPTSEKKP